MEKKGKIIIGVVVVILVIIIGGYFYISNMDVTLKGNDTQVTLPGSYKLDDKGIATAGKTSVLFVGVGGNASTDIEYAKAVNSYGNASGYKNITNTTINGFEVFEYAAHPNELKNISTDKKTTSEGIRWSEFKPVFTYTQEGVTNVDHFREITFIKGDSVSRLTIMTSNPDTSLYTPEIDKIIHSIKEIPK